MHPRPAHRSLSLAEAASEFGLEAIWNEWQGPKYDSLIEDFIVLVAISDEDEPARTLIGRVSRLNAPGIAKEFWEWTTTW